VVIRMAVSIMSRVRDAVESVGDDRRV